MAPSGTANETDQGPRDPRRRKPALKRLKEDGLIHVCPVDQLIPTPPIPMIETKAHSHRRGIVVRIMTIAVMRETRKQTTARPSTRKCFQLRPLIVKALIDAMDAGIHW
jgi:hypothetical protein